jgi:ABC-type amino acid transport substrate-binding protein
MSDIIARTQFAKAQRISLPEMAHISQAFLEVADNKADIFIEDPSSFYEYEQNNPHKLKVIARDKPLRVFGVCLVFRNGETKLQGMFDKAVDELVFSGAMDQILNRYEPSPGQFCYRRALPYKQLR